MRSYDGINGVLVTAVSDADDFDYHYRYFWPWAGTNEDLSPAECRPFRQSIGQID